MEEPTISFNELIHPDMDAIAKRDAFLSDREDVRNVEFVNGEIHADIDLGGLGRSRYEQVR